MPVTVSSPKRLESKAARLVTEISAHHPQATVLSRSNSDIDRSSFPRRLFSGKLSLIHI